MKILICAETYYPDVMGGGEYSTKQMTEGLVKRGHKVTVYCLGKDNCEEEIDGVHIIRRYIKGISEHYINLTKKHIDDDPLTRTDRIIKKLPDLYRNSKWYNIYRDLISKEDPDVVHTASPMSYLGRMNLWRAAYDLNIPVSHVCRSRHLLEIGSLAGRLDDYNIRRNAGASAYLTALAAPSGYALESHNRVGIRGQRFNDVIYNAIDFKPLSPTADLMAGKEDMVLFAGEISEKKGIDTLIRAMDGLKDVRLLLIGRPGPEKRKGKTCHTDHVKEDIVSGIAADRENIEVIDWMDREDLYAHMRRVKAVILPSKWEEPFGRVLIEAIGNATLAIGSDRGGIPEILDHNIDYIFESGDHKGLQSRIRRVIDMSPSAYMEEVCRQQKVLAGFSDGAYIDNWERFFLRQLN